MANDWDAAVEAGIAQGALDDAVAFAQQHARPNKHSTAQRSVDDPYVQWSVGEIAARGCCCWTNRSPPSTPSRA